MPRIAYFILAHAQAEQLARLVTQLNTANTHFYIHIDANTPTETYTSMKAAVKNIHCNATFIGRQPCRWGGFSLVDASLRLIKAAIQDGFDWGVLLSGQDYPIHSNEYITEFLNSSQEAGFIELKPAAEFDVAYRYRAWHFEALNGKASGKALQKIQRWANACGIQRQLPSPLQAIHAGSQWWILSERACKTMLSWLEINPNVTAFFKRTLVPDEMFFQTVLMHTGLANKLNPKSMRHLEWNKGAWSPKTFQADEIKTLNNRPELFARKFSADVATEHALDLLHQQQKKSTHL
ncbi:beta-1,6-N-acetylglucosaminyltransferase [Deefgea tanakiae]|uniref:Peptide O-xylosyltransferase n=1 Tax=Deefgea tanakiae TaxID=2865840 RepID=A0ABX8ZD02_9NEIS|nr:beta-1,6-N-acetylglucosaminyltransferase [Deefgea tanakiae]QZA78754.1 beta-1,6-N-acetylglucosaminyltransferase [Deefgea tanakiae]